MKHAFLFSMLLFTHIAVWADEIDLQRAFLLIFTYNVHHRMSQLNRNRVIAVCPVTD